MKGVSTFSRKYCVVKETIKRVTGVKAAYQSPKLVVRVRISGDSHKRIIMSLDKLKTTGNPDIDGTHKLIIEILEEIISNIKGNLLYSVHFKIQDLLLIASTHFREEEQLMRDINYPFIESHLVAHNDIILKLLHLLKLYNRPVNSILWLLSILEKAILNHVEHYDVNLFEYNNLIIKNTRLV